MQQGLQIWDEGGNLILNTMDRIVRYLGSVETGQYAGSVTVPQFSEGTPFWSPIQYDNTGGALMYYNTPKVSISGNVLSWDLSSDGITSNTPIIIAYGVY